MSRPAVVVVLLLLSACSSGPRPETLDGGGLPDAGADAGSPDAGADPTALPDDPTLEQLVAWWDANLACRVFACENRVRETEATCAWALGESGIPYDTFRRAAASVAAGRATYDAAAGRSCAAILKTIPLTGDCFGDDVVPIRQAYGAGFVSHCTDLVDGTVAHGGACDFDGECLNDGGCEFNRSDDCSGQCVVWLRNGEACDQRPADCLPTSYCDGTKCKSRNLAPDGSQCFDGGESCLSGQCFDYQCRTTSPYDGECIEDDDCAQGLFCRPLPPSTGRLGICKQPVLEDAACGLLVDCAGNQTCTGYFTKSAGGWVEGKCGGEPNGIGEDCVPIAEGFDAGDTGCYSDLLCDPGTSKCIEAPTIGASCIGDRKACGFRAYCDAEGTCRAKKAPGEPATTGAECLDDFDSFDLKCYRREDRDRCGRF